MFPVDDCVHTRTRRSTMSGCGMFLCGMNSLDFFAGFLLGGGGEFAFPFGNKSVNTLERTPYNGQKPVNLRNYSDVQCSSVKFGVFLRHLFGVSNSLHSGFNMHDLDSTYKHVCKSSKFTKSYRLGKK